MPESAVHRLNWDTYVDRVLGAWIGKSLGGSIGAPYESHKMFGEVSEEVCWPSIIYPNDDLDIQVVWLEMLEDIGPLFTQQDLVRYWQQCCWYNFAEYGAFLYNVQRGVNPPLSGAFNNHYFRESEGCPIRAEIWGLIAPGAPRAAADFAQADGELDHIGVSVAAERFWAAATALALVQDNLDDIIRAAHALSVSEASDDEDLLGPIIDMVYALTSQPMPLKRMWLHCVREYGDRDCSKAALNFAFSLLPLLYGAGDFKRTIVTALALGWDVDCTAGEAGALLGALFGAQALPADWVNRLGPNLTCDVAVRHKQATLRQLAEDTCLVGLEMLASGTIETGAGLITDIPAAVQDRLDERQADRVRKHRSVSHALFDVTYEDDNPVLWPAPLATPVRLTLDWLGREPADGCLSFRSDLAVYPAVIETRLQAGCPVETTVYAAANADCPVIWDKNLVHARLETREGTTGYTFGLVGSREWLVYGPYWDAWDRDRFGDVCPYRNTDYVDHPIRVPGCHDVLFHQFARMQTAYLDEQRLLTHDLPDEYPMELHLAEDRITHTDLGGYTGEAVYYFVRTFVSREPVSCSVNIGATGPLVVWVDGEEVYRSDKVQPWFPQDHQFTFQCDDMPRRVVVKCARVMDEFCFSWQCIKADIPGDKTVGVSFVLDCLGNLRTSAMLDRVRIHEEDPA